MFLTMKSFLIFFFVMLTMIILGILFEERLIEFEERLKETALRIVRAVWRVFCAIVNTIRDYRRGKEFAKTFCNIKGGNRT